jgi:hypothetical protein
VAEGAVPLERCHTHRQITRHVARCAATWLPEFHSTSPNVKVSVPVPMAKDTYVARFTRRNVTCGKGRGGRGGGGGGQPRPAPYPRAPTYTAPVSQPNWNRYGYHNAQSFGYGGTPQGRGRGRGGQRGGPPRGNKRYHCAWCEATPAGGMYAFLRNRSTRACSCARNHFDDLCLLKHSGFQDRDSHAHQQICAAGRVCAMLWGDVPSPHQATGPRTKRTTRPRSAGPSRSMWMPQPRSNGTGAPCGTSWAANAGRLAHTLVQL